MKSESKENISILEFVPIVRGIMESKGWKEDVRLSEATGIATGVISRFFNKGAISGENICKLLLSLNLIKSENKISSDLRCNEVVPCASATTSNEMLLRVIDDQGKLIAAQANMINEQNERIKEQAVRLKEYSDNVKEQSNRIDRIDVGATRKDGRVEKTGILLEFKRSIGYNEKNFKEVSE